MQVKHINNNQYIIETQGIVYFKSFGRTIAKIKNGIIYLDRKYWDYLKHKSSHNKINSISGTDLLGLTPKDIKQMLKSKELILTDLH